jgi:YrhK-like protein
VGAFPPYADHVDERAVSLTFFVGSIFFTLAAYLQYVQVVNATGTGTARTRLLAWQPGRIDWWAASVQSVGTLLFNISTLSAVDTTFSVQQQNRLVWAPDMLGSVAFMIASILAWVSVCHGWWAPRPHDRAWWVAALNLAGSIAFQISALAAFVRPATGEVLDLPVANLGTFLGAAAFFAGAALLIPRRSGSG